MLASDSPTIEAVPAIPQENNDITRAYEQQVDDEIDEILLPQVIEQQAILSTLKQASEAGSDKTDIFIKFDGLSEQWLPHSPRKQALEQTATAGTADPNATALLSLQPPLPVASEIEPVVNEKGSTEPPTTEKDTENVSTAPTLKESNTVSTSSSEEEQERAKNRSKRRRCCIIRAVVIFLLALTTAILAILYVHRTEENYSYGVSSSPSPKPSLRKRTTSSPTIASDPKNTTTQFPTQVPTLGPTQNSTLGPTQNSTLGPTQNSTLGPTQNSTLGPTQNSTLGPTQYSTLGPTQNSTQASTTALTPDPTQNTTEPQTQAATQPPSNVLDQYIFNRLVG